MTKQDNAPDFSAYLLSTTGRVEISLPNGNPMLYEGARVAVNVYSPASPEYARAEAALNRAASQRLMGGNRPANEAEDEAEIDARFLASVTSSVENFPYPGGIPAMYRERRLRYIGEQVRAYLREQSNFFDSSKAS